MLFGEIDTELVADFFGTSLDFSVEGAITINNNEPKSRFAFKDTVQGTGFESVFATVDTDINGFKRLEVDHKFLVGLAVFVDEVVAAEKHESVRGTLVVEFDTFSSIGDRLLNRLTIHLVLDVIGFAILFIQHGSDFFKALFGRNVDTDHRGSVSSAFV